MRGLPPGMEQLLRRKYDILQQQADSGTTSANANATAANAAARLDRTRADLLPEEARVNNELTRQRGRLMGQQADFFGRTAEAEIANLLAQAGLNRARGANVAADTESRRQINQFFELDRDVVAAPRSRAGFGLGLPLR